MLKAIFIHHYITGSAKCITTCQNLSPHGTDFKTYRGYVAPKLFQNSIFLVLQGWYRLLYLICCKQFCFLVTLTVTKRSSPKSNHRSIRVNIELCIVCRERWGKNLFKDIINQYSIINIIIQQLYYHLLRSSLKSQGKDCF